MEIILIIHQKNLEIVVFFAFSSKGRIFFFFIPVSNSAIIITLEGPLKDSQVVVEKIKGLTTNIMLDIANKFVKYTNSVNVEQSEFCAFVEKIGEN